MRPHSIGSATLLVGATCLTVLATVAAPVPAQPEATAAPASVLTPAAIDSLVAAKMEEAGLMGLAGSVFVDGREVWSKGYGHRDYLRTQPFTPTTPMSIASISKTFTGVAMMRLVAEGKLDLDADVNRYLPLRVRNPRFPDIPITLRMIATHTSSASPASGSMPTRNATSSRPSGCARPAGSCATYQRRNSRRSSSSRRDGQSRFHATA
jgi:CubicO group peptidase (beta-lactamase class C family)